MTAKIILHAGTHKTGTTAIQGALFDNRAALAERGVYYPEIWAVFPVSRKLQSNRAHFALAQAIADFSPRDQAHLRDFTDHLRQAGERYRRIVLSAESFYRHILENPARPGRGGDAASFREARIRYVERLAEVFAGLDLEILLYLRRPDRFAEALYAESIVASGNRGAFETFIETRPFRFDYRFQIDLFARFFPVRVCGFEEAVRAGLVESFFRDNGLGAPLPLLEERRRASISNRAVRWLQRTKREAPDMSSRERRRRWLFALQPAAADEFRAEAPSSFWRSTASRDGFLARCRTGVHEVTWPEPGPDLPPFCTWSDAEHRRAEAAYRAWDRDNAAWIAAREAARVPPYVAPVVDAGP